MQATDLCQQAFLSGFLKQAEKVRKRVEKQAFFGDVGSSISDYWGSLSPSTQNMLIGGGIGGGLGASYGALTSKDNSFWDALKYGAGGAIGGGGLGYLYPTATENITKLPVKPKAGLPVKPKAIVQAKASPVVQAKAVAQAKPKAIVQAKASPVVQAKSKMKTRNTKEMEATFKSTWYDEIAKGPKRYRSKDSPKCKIGSALTNKYRGRIRPIVEITPSIKKHIPSYIPDLEYIIERKRKEGVTNFKEIKEEYDNVQHRNLIAYMSLQRLFEPEHPINVNKHLDYISRVNRTYTEMRKILNLPAKD